MTERNIRFRDACLRVISENADDGGIGTLGEKSVHRILKYYIEPNEEYHERKYLGCVADIMRPDCIYEIQTRAMERMRVKLDRFLPMMRVCIVLPVFRDKTIRYLSKETGEISEPRRSPKKESVFTALRELYKIRTYLSSENLSFKLVIMSVEEYRYSAENNKKRGANKIDRMPTSLIDDIDICGQQWYRNLLPSELPEEFSAKQLCDALGAPKRLSSCIAGVFSSVGIIEFVRKQKNAYIYKIK